MHTPWIARVHSSYSLFATAEIEVMHSCTSKGEMNSRCHYFYYSTSSVVDTVLYVVIAVVVV